METMQQDIGISQIPTEYGGQSSRALDDSDDKRKVTPRYLLSAGFLSRHSPPQVAHGAIGVQLDACYDTGTVNTCYDRGTVRRMLR